MPRYQDAVPSTPSQYEQRPTPRRVHDHEGKRRRVLRWLKKTMGLSKVEKEEAHASPVNQCPQPYDEPPRAIRRASLTHGNVKDAPSLSLGSHSSTYDQDLEHPSFYAPSSSGRPLSLSSLATSSLNVPAPSSPQPSIYEYHHQMPRHRKPRLDSSRVVTNGRPHVLIIGGGIGGLCLAQGLKKNGIPFTIFERDPTPNYRTQGYRLRINNAGLEALKYNLMGEDFEVFLRSTGHFGAGFMYVNALTGGAAPESVKNAHRAGSTHHVLSTDRSMLRSLLLTDLHEGTEILFGMAFKKYDILANGRIEVQFENGQCFDGSVLVGADGTTSRVRRQYIPHHITLLDTDSAAIYGKTPITPEIEQYFATATTTVVASQHPHMAVVIDPRCGSKFHIEDYIESTGGIENPANEELADLHNYLCWVLIARSDLFRMDEDDDMTIQDLYAMSPEEVAELSIQMTSSWCPRVRALFETQDAEWCSFLRLSTMAPEINSWQPSQVTLLGDACHTMIPAGIGCNTAMLDARLLVESFCEYGVTIEAIARYENAMRQHGQEGIEVSMEAGRTLFGLPEQDDMRKIVY